ncbi:MAG: response regulator transcription factor [Rhodospirillales bacterium]|nr:response regulator transcription factor [Rhodospirillales bacterium]
MRPILIVDHDAAVRALLAEQLGHAGEFAPRGAASLAEAERMALASPGFDAILLETAMPDGDGLVFCTRMRQLGVRIPILIVSAQAAEGDIVRGLDAGANDYIAKPFRLRELLARLRAQLRQQANGEEAILQLGAFRFNASARSLTDAAGQRIRLTEKEAAILTYLHRAAPLAVPRETLLAAVWGYNSRVSTHTLETHVYRLRRKLGDSAGEMIATEGRGYRLDAAAGTAAAA